MIKAIIFDFFGVFCPDLYWNWLSSIVKDLDSRREFFLELSKKVDKSLMTREEFNKTLAEEIGVSSEEVNSNMGARIKINQEVVELASELKKKYKIGLLSNASNILRDEILGKYDLEKYFNEIVISSEVKHIKPEPAMFEEIIRRLGVKNDEAVFFDDHQKNVDAAEKLGIQSLLYESNEKLVEDLKDLRLLGSEKS